MNQYLAGSLMSIVRPEGRFVKFLVAYLARYGSQSNFKASTKIF